MTQRKFKRSEKQLLVLEFIRDNNPRYTDIVKFAYELSYGKDTYSYDVRGYWSAVFCTGTSNHYWGGMPQGWVNKLTYQKESCGHKSNEYQINDEGLLKIKILRGYFRNKGYKVFDPSNKKPIASNFITPSTTSESDTKEDNVGPSKLDQTVYKCIKTWPMGPQEGTHFKYTSEYNLVNETGYHIARQNLKNFSEYFEEIKVSKPYRATITVTETYVISNFKAFDKEDALVYIKENFSPVSPVTTSRDYTIIQKK